MCYLRVSGWLTRSASAHHSARSYQQQQVWYDAMQCTDMRSHVVPDVVSRFPQTTTHWPTRLGRSPPARAVKKHPRLHASSCASITQSTSVNHSAPRRKYRSTACLIRWHSIFPCLRRYQACMLQLHSSRHVMCLIWSASPPPMSFPHGTLSFSQVPACRKTTHGARWTPITPVLQLRETVSHASRASCLELVY